MHVKFVLLQQGNLGLTPLTLHALQSRCCNLRFETPMNTCLSELPCSRTSVQENFLLTEQNSTCFENLTGGSFPFHFSSFSLIEQLSGAKKDAKHVAQPHLRERSPISQMPFAVAITTTEN